MLRPTAALHAVSSVYLRPQTSDPDPTHSTLSAGGVLQQPKYTGPIQSGNGDGEGEGEGEGEGDLSFGADLLGFGDADGEGEDEGLRQMPQESV